MSGKKELLASWLDRTGLCTYGLRHGLHNLTILAYHRVFDIADESRFPGDPEIVSASVNQFRRQMAYLREHWNPISLSAAIQSVYSGEMLEQRTVAVTFDDGHVDNYTYALPVLREFGIPATIFLSTQYIGTQDAFWFDRIATLLFYAPAETVHVESVPISLHLTDITSRRSEAERLQSVLKRLPDTQRHVVLRELEDKFGAHVAADSSGQSASLNWDQVREMTQHGIDFGSHTVTHPILSTQPDDRVRFELEHSRETIRQQTGQPADLLAYPVGKPYTFNSRTIEIAKECGYRAALAYIDGVNDPLTVDRFALRRIAVERYMSHSLFMARMTYPRVFV